MSVQDNLESISIKELIGKAVANWYLFAIALGVLLPLAYLYSQTLVKATEVRAKLSLSDKSTDQLASNEGLKELGILEQYSDLEDKIQVISSYALIEDAVEKIPFEVAYYEEKLFNSIQVYRQQSPFYVIIDSTKPQLLDVPFSVSQSAQGFKLTFEIEEQGSIYNIRTGDKVRGLGPMEMEIFSDENGMVTSDFLNVEIIPNVTAGGGVEEGYAFKIRSNDKLVESFKKGLSIESVSDESSVVNLSSFGTIPWEHEMFLNSLMETYIESEVQKRYNKGRSTLDTITKELYVLEDSLMRVQQRRADFQASRGIAGIEGASATLYNQQFVMKDRVSNLRVQKARYQTMLSSMRSASNDPAMMPSTQDVDDIVLKDLLGTMSSLVNQRADLAGTATQNSRQIQELDRRIQQTRNSIIGNIRNRIASIDIELQETSSQLGQVTGQLSTIPGASSQITTIADQIERIHEQYDRLSEKRSELLIALANLDVNYFVIDKARITKNKTGTSKGVVMIGAFILALGLPIGYIFLTSFFNDNVLTYKDLRKHTKIPVLGMIIKNDTPYPTLRPDTTDSALAECFRALRIHIYKNIPDEARDQIRVIGAVSTWSGEGKSFCAANMAASLSMAGYKTLIIDLDLRNPNQTRHFDYEPERGVSSTLPGARHADLDSLIQPTHIPSLDIVAAGPVYHNPLDLFDGPAFRSLIDQARDKYDYVILDLPPIAQASDYLLVSEFLDYTLYVLRHHVTKVGDLDRINELHSEGKVKQIGLVMNGVANPSYFRYGDMSYYNIGRYKARYNSAYTNS